MAKRKNQLADRLNSGGSAKPGWRDIITPVQPPAEQIEEPIEIEQPAAVKPTTQKPTKKIQPTFKRKTYLVAPEMIERIETLAEQERVGINQLVRYMLDYALTEIETGKHAIPTTDGKRQINW